MVDQFQLEGRNFIEYDSNGNIIYKEFDRAYTTKQRDSIKEVADLAYGYYDHETKSLVDMGFFGLIYKQFQTFLTAKFNLWLKGRPSTQGDNTAQGHFEQVVINGEKCYRKPIISEDSKIRLEKNPLRILDSKDEGDRELLSGKRKVEPGEIITLKSVLLVDGNVIKEKTNTITVETSLVPNGVSSISTTVNEKRRIDVTFISPGINKGLESTEILFRLERREINGGEWEEIKNEDL